MLAVEFTYVNLCLFWYLTDGDHSLRLLQFLAVNVFYQLSWAVTLVEYCCVGCLDTAAKYGSFE